MALTPDDPNTTPSTTPSAPPSGAADARPGDPLEQATALVRAESAEPPQQWGEVRERIRDRVRLLVLPAEPVRLSRLDGAAVDDRDSTMTVSSRVLRAAVRQRLSGSTTHVPDAIDLEIEDELLTGLRLELVVAFGADLTAVVGRVRDDVAEALATLLGPDLGFGTPLRIDVEIVDVVPGDPRLV